MKIISRFHDYYDTVLSHGHDETCTFYRNSKQTGASDLSPPLDFLIPYLSESGYPWSTFTSSMEKSRTCYFFRAFLVLFCGKLYHGIGIDKYHQEKKNGNTLYFYSHEELEAYCEEHKLVYECHQLWKSGHDETLKKIKEWLKNQGDDKYFEQLVEEGISIAVFYGGGRGVMRMNHDPNTFNCKALLDLLHHKPSYLLKSDLPKII